MTNKTTCPFCKEEFDEKEAGVKVDYDAYEMENGMTCDELFTICPFCGKKIRF